MSRISVSLKTKTNKRLERTLKGLKDGSVKVGWIKGEKYKDNGMYVAENAYFQNKGFTITQRSGKKIYVPPRPFLDITISKNSAKWQSFWKAQYKSTLEGKTSLKTALNKLGTIVKTAIQNTIKKRKGSPLIPLMDSMRMYDTINYESKVGNK